jgi:hypothetical protein
MRFLAIPLAFALVPASAFAQPRQFENWKETATLRAPKSACGDLRALTTYTFSIDTATLNPAGNAACIVEGQILPEIRFEVSLPATWNGRLYMFGNGGFAGENLANPGRQRIRDRALAAGFAIAQTNTGHDGAREPLASFALNPQKLIDYAYRAVHMTAVTAKDVARAYYGSPISRSYFDGCSTGGRQALMAAQRFPADFDGIIATAPVLDLTGTMLHFAQMQQAFRHAPRLIDKVELLSSKIYAKCDAIDGLTDGLIADPRKCPFDPAADVPACPAGTSSRDCLTPEELTAVKAVYAAIVINGVAAYPAFPVGSEVTGPTPGGNVPGWQGWMVSPKPPTISELFTDTFFKYMVTPGREIDWRTFDAARDAGVLQKPAALLNATDPDLRPFRARGGKMTMYFGWADPALNPTRLVEYYDAVQKTTGPSDDFLRLYMMPGVFHCGGGPGPDGLDTMTPLVEWVERGVAPQQLVATKRQGEKTTRSRPLCPYPQVATYKGSGSVDEASSFVCQAIK